MRTLGLVRLSLMLVPAVCCLGYALDPAPPPPERIVANIDASKLSTPISKYEYGMFIEHLGSLIYRSLWSEMLDDRKFYYPISFKEPDAATRAPSSRPRMFLPRQWRPVGADDVVVMDKDQPFVGEESPRIELDPSTPHGIQQSGLALVKGNGYTGHIILRGAPRAKVNVTLIWGQAANDRQTVSLSALPSAYREFPLSFVAGADTGDGTLEITGTGSGNFHIGTVSLMPADNVQGQRCRTCPAWRETGPGPRWLPAALVAA